MKRSYDISKGVRAAWEYRAEPERMHLLAGYFWIGVLGTGFVVAVCIALYGIWIFWGLFRGGTETPGVIAPTPFSRAQIESTLDYFEQRASRYEELSRSRPAVSDPSR